MAMTNFDDLARVPGLSSSLDNTDMLVGGPFLVQLSDVQFVGTELEVLSGGGARFFDAGRGIYIHLPRDSEVLVDERDASATVSFGDTTYALKPITLDWFARDDESIRDVFPTDESVRDHLYQRLIDRSVGPRYMVTIDGDNVVGLYRLINNRVYVRNNGTWDNMAQSSTELEDAERSVYVVDSFIDVFDQNEYQDTISVADVERFFYDE